MWETKIFQTQQQLNDFIQKIKSNYQYEIIFVNNGYGIEYKKLKEVY